MIQENEQKEKLTFESAISQLEEILRSMEEEELPLEELLCRFEKGMKLLRFCQEQLSAAEQRVKILLEEEGVFKVEPFSKNGLKNIPPGE